MKRKNKKLNNKQKKLNNKQFVLMYGGWRGEHTIIGIYDSLKKARQAMLSASTEYKLGTGTRKKLNIDGKDRVGFLNSRKRCLYDISWYIISDLDGRIQMPTYCF